MNLVPGTGDAGAEPAPPSTLTLAPKPPASSPGEPSSPPESSGDDRARALHALCQMKPRLLLTSNGVHSKVRREADRLPVDAALGVLGFDVAVLAEAQAFCARHARDARPPDALGGGSVWDFFRLWVEAEPSDEDRLNPPRPYDPDDEESDPPPPVPPTAWRGDERLYATAFQVAWLFCVAMQGRGAFPPAVYLRALGLALPKGAETLAEVAGVPSVHDVARACQRGWADVYASNLAHHLRGAWRALGGADVSTLLYRASETPDEHASTG